MPDMERPVSARRNRFKDVKIGRPQNQNQPQSNLPKTITGEEKERLLNKLSGYKPTNDLYVDGKTHNKMGKDEFLKLHTHQLQNQDPLKPMDQSKMAGELAQFSQLEQLANLNTKFEKMNPNVSVEGKFYGASFLGKEVVTNGRSLDFKGENTEADILFTLPKPATKALIRIYDSSNNMMAEMWKENLGRGNQSVMWDGTALDGTTQAAGQYRVDVKAWDQFSEPMEVATKVKGSVESVFFENGEMVLKVDGKKVFLRDVDSFHMPGTDKEALSKRAPVQANKPMDSANAVGAKMVRSKLPVASNSNSKLNFNKPGQVENMAQNKTTTDNISTGITDVYDVK